MDDIVSQDRSLRNGLQWAREEFGEDFMDQYAGVLTRTIVDANAENIPMVHALRDKVHSLLKRQRRMVVNVRVGQPPISWVPSGRRVYHKPFSSENQEED